MLVLRRVAQGAMLAIAFLAPPELGARQAQSAPPSQTIQERLARVRNEIFTRPDRGNASVKELHAILALDPNLAEAHLLLGLVHAGRGTSEMRAEAAAEFRQALEIEPELMPARFYLARVYFDLGQIERAREELLTLTTRVPTSAQFVATLGEAERRSGNPGRAVELARQALGLEPGSAEARYYLGLAFFDLNRVDEAIVELETVAKSNPNIPTLYPSLGLAYLKAGRTDAAIQALTLGIKLFGAQPDARIALARAYRLKGMLPQADVELARVFPPGASLETSARNQQLEADVSFERGLVLLAQNRRTAARQAFDEALAMNPSPEMKSAIDAALAPASKGVPR